MKMKILKHYRPNEKMNHASWTIMKNLKYKGQRGKKKIFKGQTFSLVYNFTEDLSRK